MPRQLLLPAFEEVSLDAGVAAALERLPPSAGVAQIVGPGGGNLLIGSPANLRRWAGTHLGAARVRKGRRPPTDLSPVATAVRYATTSGRFQQRLVYERLMAAHVPTSARRDLKAPVFLHLDPAERFPRLTVRAAASDRRPLFGPFLKRADAERARQFLNRHFALRPCDFAFEPDPELPLGLGCLYAQTRACAAPCLRRVSEESYRAIAHTARAFLAEPAARPELVEALPPWMAAATSRGIVVEGLEDALVLYPVHAWSVLEEQAIEADAASLEAAVPALRWPEAPAGRDDLAWLVSWLRVPGRAAYLSVDRDEEPKALAARARAAIMRGTP